MQIRKKILPGQFNLPNCHFVIIDTDAGGDDAQAIVLAIAEAKRTNKTILGITCVDGNAFIDDVAKNVLIATTMAGAPQIPIYKGSRLSMTGPNFKDYYFGKDGFGMKQQTYIAKLKAEKKWKEQTIHQQGALEFLIDCAEKHPNDLAIIAIGPLTNLALAYHLDNSFAEKVAMVSLMGGSISAFGIRQFFAAEFNFYLDAQSAKIVIEAFPFVCISSFDLSFDLGTIKTLPLFTEDAKPKAKLIHDIHSHILETHRPAVCDPLACIPVFSPQIVKSIYQAYGQVETAGQRTRGLLIFDWFEKSRPVGLNKVWAVAEIDLDGFIKHIDSSYD